MDEREIRKDLNVSNPLYHFFAMTDCDSEQPGRSPQHVAAEPTTCLRLVAGAGGHAHRGPKCCNGNTT